MTFQELLKTVNAWQEVRVEGKPQKTLDAVGTASSFLADSSEEITELKRKMVTDLYAEDDSLMVTLE